MENIPESPSSKGTNKNPIDCIVKRMEGEKGGEYEVFGWFKTHVLDSKLETGIEHQELTRQLIDQNMYWFAISSISSLLKGLAQGRKEKISLLSRGKHKEVMLASLEKKRLRMSPLDMIGSGHLRNDQTPTGLIIRVSKD